MKKLNNIQDGENSCKEANKKELKTILDHIGQILELIENSGLNDEFFQKAKKSIDFVSENMNLTTNQAILFALFIEKCESSDILISEFSKLIGCRTVKIIGMMSDIDELEKRRLVRCARKSKSNSYRVPMDVIKALKQNVAYTAGNTQNLTNKELFEYIARLFGERVWNEISCELLRSELNTLIEDNPTLAFCRQIKEYEKVCADENNFLLLLLFCHRYINRDDDSVGFYDFDDLYEDRWVFKKISSGLRSGENALIRNNILEYSNENGFEDREYFRISTTAKEKLFVEFDIDVTQKENTKELLLHECIAPKQLFYNKKEQLQVEQLASLLEKDNFLSIQEKLEQNGMRKGFACLFYGSPGTGKTETVYQIARSTGRNIMAVDISETKSMWYGESEKRIKGIFDKYKKLSKTCEIAPILLFNEADAVIGKRSEAVNGKVEKTENAIQNILLQEIENLTGIMIATTNLTQNMDKAFERRFLYKIEFEKPSVKAKAKIWSAVLPILAEEECIELANRYDFSGGQIENIVRKYTVDSILNGIEPTMESIHSYCQSEFLYKNQEQRKIGFTV